MTRDDLEAEIWHAMRQHGTQMAYAEKFVDRVLAAADQYGLAEFGLSAQRRRELLAEAVGGGSYGGRAS